MWCWCHFSSLIKIKTRNQNVKNRINHFPRCHELSHHVQQHLPFLPSSLPSLSPLSPPLPLPLPTLSTSLSPFHLLPLPLPFPSSKMTRKTTRQCQGNTKMGHHMQPGGGQHSYVLSFYYLGNYLQQQPMMTATHNDDEGASDNVQGFCCICRCSREVLEVCSGLFCGDNEHPLRGC